MAPLPPRPSWVTLSDGAEPPDGYAEPLEPWRPAGRKSLTQSQVFLNQVPVPSRPSSAPSTAAPSARPSSGRSSCSRPPSAAPSAPRPQSAPVRPQSAPRRLQPPSRPSSAWQRPSSAPAGPRNATNGVSVSWRGRRYRVRQTNGDRSQLSQTSLESANAMASFSIYTDHGLSDDDYEPPVVAEGAGTGAQGAAKDAQPPDAEKAEMAHEAESEDSSTSDAEAAASAAEAAKMWSGKATLGVLQVTVAERPLYAELTLGGATQSTSCVTGRWPSLAEELTFQLKDIRVEEILTLCFWTSVGECKSRPRCVAYGKGSLNFEEKERQVTITLDVHQNGQLLRGLAVLHLQVSGHTSEADIFDHSDENCSRNLLLSRRGPKGRRFRGIKERPVGPMDRVMDVNARCWSYLEQRSSFLKFRRQECHQRIRRAQALRAGPPANQGWGCAKHIRTPKLSRISSEQAFRLQRFLRSFVKCGQHGSRELAKVTADAFKASELRHFLFRTLQVPHLSEDDASALGSLLCEDGEVQMKTFLNFVEHGVTVVPPARVIYPDEERAREILKEMFPGFLAKEQQREMESPVF